MAKSKQVKQTEALARKRANYNHQVEEVKKYRFPDADLKKKMLLSYGSVTDNELVKNAERRFQKYLEEAKLNEEGRPLLFSTEWSQLNKQSVGRLNRPNATSLHEYLVQDISK